MNDKPIVSAITFLLISMFYVASASAGPTYMWAAMPKTCGNFDISRGSQDCLVRGPRSGKAGVEIPVPTCAVRWVDGKGSVQILTDHCGPVVITLKMDAARVNARKVYVDALNRMYSATVKEWGGGPVVRGGRDIGHVRVGKKVRKFRIDSYGQEP
jgi:hypothetical protein